ncbi:hypothetical protein C8J57DRAFT_529562 [Mycena rebaudengoi]|nr:hypothetical protein C8J57DRAFT_529562 [Mycena rebaudengoi]
MRRVDGRGMWRGWGLRMPRGMAAVGAGHAGGAVCGLGNASKRRAPKMRTLGARGGDERVVCDGERPPQLLGMREMLVVGLRGAAGPCFKRRGRDSAEEDRNAKIGARRGRWVRRPDLCARRGGDDRGARGGDERGVGEGEYPQERVVLACARARRRGWVLNNDKGGPRNEGRQSRARRMRLVVRVVIRATRRVWASTRGVG